MQFLLIWYVWCRYRSRLAERGVSFRRLRRLWPAVIERVCGELECTPKGTPSLLPYERRELRARW